ncbi:MAG: hypothetical protein DRI69_10195 [Bacteroidetes bacterium]|nr:MAG: hypothetical protein DRI69_10195 [Bacteroidota bacterium]
MKPKSLLKPILVIFTIAITVCFMDVSAQDVIILKTGKKVEAKIIEINDVEVKYREYNDPDGIIFTMSRGKIREIRYETGRREKEVPEEMDEAYYVDDGKQAIKLNFFALAGATTILLYEYGLNPGSSLEAALKINGLGFNNDEGKSGFGIDIGYKVKMGSLFRKRDSYRPKHFLAGGYFKPVLGFNHVNFDDGYSYNKYTYVHFGFDFGVQWILRNAVALDLFLGWHYYGGSFDDKYSGDTGSGGDISDGNLFGASNSAVSLGMNIGGVFGKSRPDKKKKGRR